MSEYRFIALAGVDGAGKTTVLRCLETELDLRRVAHRHVWSRFRNYTSKPLLALARLTGHNRKEMAGGQAIGYHDFQNAPWIAWPFLWLQVIDNLFDMAWRYRETGGRVIVSDRSVVDTLVDLAVDTGFDDFIIGWLGPRLIRQLPNPKLVVIIERSPAKIAKDRPDAAADKHFARRRALYQRLARSQNIPVIANNRLPDDAADEIISLVTSDVEPAWKTSHDLRVLQ